MPKITDPKVEGMVLAFSDQNLTQRDIVAKLKSNGVVISQKTVSNILNSSGKKREAKQKGFPSPPKRQPSRVATPTVRRKLDALNSRANPASQRELAKKN